MKNPYTPEGFFGELFDFRRDFDQMFNRILKGTPWNVELPEFKSVGSITPALEAYVDKEGKKYVCRIALPGVEPKDVYLQVQGNILMVRGERKLAHRTKETELFEEGIAYGWFERELTLPEGVNIEKLAAEYFNGVLEITAPVAAAALPRKIEIKTTVPLVKQMAA